LFSYREGIADLDTGETQLWIAVTTIWKLAVTCATTRRHHLEVLPIARDEPLVERPTVERHKAIAHYVAELLYGTGTTA
jgi:hypothetical protein